VSVELNGTTYTITVDEALQSGYSTLVDCGDLDTFYVNFVVVSCENAALSADSSACEASETETVISSTVSLELTSSAETTEEELEAALNTEESQEALTESLAESLGIDAARITIVSVTVTAARLLQEKSGAVLARALTAASSFNVELDYEVQTDSTINDTATIQESMTSIGEDGSNESATFSEAFVTNMEIAANATVNTTSSILTTLVDTVKEKGITVSVVAAPTVVTRVITTTTTTASGFVLSEPTGGSDGAGASTGVVIVIILLVIAVLVAVGVVAFVAYRRGALPLGKKASPDGAPAADEAAGGQEAGLTSGAEPTHVVWGADELRTMGGSSEPETGASTHTDAQGVNFSSV